MKRVILSLSILASLLILQSFTSKLKNAPQGNNPIKKSKIVWKAYKVAGSHEGTVNLKSGSLSFENEKLTGGEFVLDMNTLTCTDLSGEYRDKLDGHLKSDDFFGVKKHSTSKLVITKVKSTGKNAYKVSADLTIKGITKSIEFDASVYGKKATANLKIDRTQYDIKYGSGSFFEGLKDNMIYDEFDLVVDLEF